MRYRKAWSFSLFTAGEEGYAIFRIPTVLTLQDGRVLAFAEGRRHSLSDSGEIDIVEKISTDGGRTFGPIRVAVSGGGHTAGNQCPVYDRETGRIILLFNRNAAEGPEHLILKGLAERTVHMTTSADGGETWSPERDITGQTKLPDWTWHAIGPCHALQMPSGRLVFPCNHAVLNEKEGSSGPYISHTLYSDNHGETWNRGADIAFHTNECTLALRGDGKLLMNMRTFTKHGCRALAVSADGGETFAECRMEPSLPEPCCQGSMLTVQNGEEEVILFSNPSSQTERVRLMIHETSDGGASWQEGCLVTGGAAAYSDLTQLQDGRIAVMYETGNESPYERIEWTVLDFE